MNAVDLLLERELPARAPAFYPLDGVPCDFGTLSGMALRASARLDSLGLGPADTVLLADSISAEFYACVMAVLARGSTLILVEPFLPLNEIDSIVSRMKPALFLASWAGRLWGARAGAIRRIPRWESARGLTAGASTAGVRTLKSVPVPPDHPGIITFTSGTTGSSKGVVRTHSGLTAQNHAIRISGGLDAFQKPDLAVFANLVLANLGMGRATVFVPPGWKSAHLKRLRDLPEAWRPVTLSSGPAFLRRLMESGCAPALESIHVGGALSDCADLERAFRFFGDSTRFLHVYGSSEAEPVAFSDARESVSRSRERGYRQALFLGREAKGIRLAPGDDGLWVTGNHVCQRYVGNESESIRNKRTDSTGATWHFMGDRVRLEESGLWFGGRSFQSEADFELEQGIYGFLGHTSAFIEVVGGRERVLKGEGVEARASELLIKFPQINRIRNVRIRRDRRHRSRIDREASR